MKDDMLIHNSILRFSHLTWHSLGLGGMVIFGQCHVTHDLLLGTFGIGQPKAELATGAGVGKEGPHANQVVSGAGGFLGFLQGYPNPLTRFGFSGTVIGVDGSGGALGGSSATPNLAIALPEANLDKEGSSGDAVLGSGSDANPASGSEMASSALEVTPGRPLRQRYYQFSTLVFVALIAFLIGSLLRSLLSPADFIYVVSDFSEADKANGVGIRGWREIRRLVEIKYLIGGWDLQVAVVRRH